jgi:hypothetical protein
MHHNPRSSNYSQRRSNNNSSRSHQNSGRKKPHTKFWTSSQYSREVHDRAPHTGDSGSKLRERNRSSVNGKRSDTVSITETDSCQEPRLTFPVGSLETGARITNVDFGLIRGLFLTTAPKLNSRAGLLSKESRPNERGCETVGDSVLGMVVAEQLVEIFTAHGIFLGSNRVQQMIALLTTNDAIISIFNFHLAQRGPQTKHLPRVISSSKANADKLEAVLGQIAVVEGIDAARKFVRSFHAPIWSSLHSLYEQSLFDPGFLSCDSARLKLQERCPILQQSLPCHDVGLFLECANPNNRKGPKAVNALRIMLSKKFSWAIVDSVLAASNKDIENHRIGILMSLAERSSDPYQLVIGQRALQVACILGLLKRSPDLSCKEMHDFWVEVNKIAQIGILGVFPSLDISPGDRDILSRHSCLDRELLLALFSQIARVDIRIGADCFDLMPRFDQVYCRLVSVSHQFRQHPNFSLATIGDSFPKKLIPATQKEEPAAGRVEVAQVARPEFDAETEILQARGKKLLAHKRSGRPLSPYGKDILRRYYELEREQRALQRA